MKETNYEQLLNKILESILNNQIKNKNDLKLFGIVEPKLQKEVLWKLFEQKVATTDDKKEKHKLINKFHKLNLL